MGSKMGKQVRGFITPSYLKDLTKIHKVLRSIEECVLNTPEEITRAYVRNVILSDRDIQELGERGFYVITHTNTNGVIFKTKYTYYEVSW
jgi:hypothetical protein